MNTLAVFADIPAPVWVALSGVISGISTWVVGMRQINVSIKRARLKTTAEALTDESAERVAFRTALMVEVADLRRLLKECDADREALRSRIYRAEEQILVLSASNAIMERWLAFFKDRNALDAHIAPQEGKPVPSF
jgi:Ribonuclease G/E